MNPRLPAMAAAFAAIQVALCPHGALAAERCPGLTIEADAAVRGQWPDLIERVEKELSARADVDACARVDLRVEGDSAFTVTVTLPDGRAAARSVTERDDIIPTLQALLLVPDPVPAPVTASAPAPVGPQRSAFIDEASRTEPPATTAARSLGVELSLFTAARIGDGQLGLGVGALSFLELSDWLVGFQGRADSYRATSGDGRKTALELAVLAGRRFDLGSTSLDLSAGLAAAMMGFDESHSRRQSVSVTRTETIAETIAEMPPPVEPSEPRSGPVPRLLLGARWGFKPLSVLGTFVGIDGEVGPRLASSDPSSASLPAYSVGFSLGATLGTP